MIEAGRAIELRDDRRKLGSESPLVAAPALRLERGAPAIPPARDRACDRLDDQDSIAARSAIEKTAEERGARAFIELVHGERGEYRASGGRQRRRGGVAAMHRRAQP